MLKSFPLSLVFILENASDGSRTQLRRRNVISFSRTWIHNQFISTLGLHEGHPVTERKCLPRASLYKGLPTTDLGVPNRGFKLAVEVQNGNKRKDYSERKIVGHSMEHLFSVVVDVEHYKNFVPYCTGSAVTSRNPTGDLTARLSVGFPPFVVDSCTSTFKLTPPNMVKFVCLPGNLFRHMVTTWKFSPGPNGNPNNCILDLDLSFEFRSSFHSQLSRMFFEQVMEETVSAFSAEATRRYGKA